ncbi:hypothetical protein WDL1CHR_03821 [Variovorax sp. WDL1]|nr:DUF3108 domain-containing protein [Variovorax sp. WDL1]KWT97896.1 hypothetical protein APY03_1036 [Variovorax sp. WDL1]PNG59266.1 hypothetical protein CHC07_00992 [Variovorax sp. B4]PNG60943.1 hypothetical protein CHC06_00843 [Variovorax sp. B2]VTV13126.1 hypothetical protein WDL1CHR_03821 [Variovorax sp. WDL1]
MHLRPAAPALPGVPRPPWRALALLAAAVLLAHMALLGLAPLAGGPHPSPLAGRFVTRTIVIAPPPEPLTAPAPEPPAASKPTAPKPARPRPAARREAPAAPTPPPADSPAPEQAAPAEATVPAEPPAAEAAPEPAAGALAGAASNGAGADAGSGADSGAAATAGQAEPPQPTHVPGSVQLAFAVTGQMGSAPMQGVFGTLVWQQDGQQYDAQLSLRFLFKTIRSQHSNGVIGAGGIEPARFSDKRRTEVAAHFMREQGQVVFSNNAPSVPLLPGAQDRLSVMLQLGALMAGDPARYPPGAAFAIQTVGPRDADLWIFKVEEDEHLTLPAGQYNARKLTRNPRKPFDDKVELWLAPELGYLPVRIRQTLANGDFADFQLRDAQGARP